MSSENETIKIAVRCRQCRRIVAYKLSTTTGHLQLKCPKCGAQQVIDLSLRRTQLRHSYSAARI